MTTQTLPTTRTGEFDSTTWPCPYKGCGGLIGEDGVSISVLIAEHLDGHRLADAATRDAALASVRTISSALREVIDGDEAMAAGLLSDLTPAHIEAVVPFLTRTLGLLVGVESTKKAAKR